MKQVLLVGLMALVSGFSSASHAGEHLPVVFAPGLGTSGQSYRDLSPLVAIFKAHGYDLRIADTVTFGSLEVRMQSFVDSVSKLVPEGPFHIVSHSTGGIDARLAIHRGEFQSRVVSLTTLAAPHRGTSGADWILSYVAEHPTSQLPAALMDALHDLTVENMALFNADVQDDPQVQYFSMGFYVPDGPIFLYTLNPLVWAGHKILDDEGPNDGIVSAASAEWGTSLGEMPADHFSETFNIPFGGQLLVEKIIDRVIANLDRF